MKKTVTINLAKTVYNIDEDAYIQLQEYFEKLKSHFQHLKDAEEILEDIESRVAELFNERLRYGMQVIGIKDVEEIIGIMGNPTDFEEASSENEQMNTEESFVDSNSNATSNDKKKKRLYRDTETGYIGGVCSGLSQYADIDIVYVRLIFILMLFIKIGFPIYIIGWLIIPRAKTTAQKLEMQGIEPTIDNIKQHIQENLEKLADKTEKELKSERTKNFIQQVGESVVNLIQTAAKVLMALIGGFFGCLGVIILLSLIAALTFSIPFIFSGLGSTVTPFGFNWYIDGLNIGNLAMFPQLVISALLFIGIPLGSIAYAIFQKIFHWRKTPILVDWIVVVIWLISFSITLYYGIHYSNQLFLMNSTPI